MIHVAYLAGMIDGEGCIGTTRTGKARSLVARVTIANTNHACLRSLKESFGGSVTVRAKGAKETWKPFGAICWTNRDAQRVLEATLPYLLIKKPQALLALELIKMRDVPKSERCDYIPAPVEGAPNRRFARVKPHVRLMEESIAAQLKHHNKKGVRGDRAIATVNYAGQVVVSLSEARKAAGK